MKSALAAALLLAMPVSARAADLPIPIVAAENFYAEVASAIGGDRVSVESVVVSAEADPHDFEPPASVARSVADARFVVMNGIEYDHWMERLVEATDAPDRTVIEVSTLIGAKEGDNPHLWYDPRAVPALADALAGALSAADPDGRAGYQSRKKAFLATLQPLDEKIGDIRGRYAGAPVTATEPVFGLMAEALGLEMRNVDFQRAIQNETEPSARQIAEMEADLRDHRVKVLFYNNQVVDPLTERLLATAEEAGVPVVGVTETMPVGATYAGWMLDQLDATERALSTPSS
ncbi:MAG: zinc ABC transporter substrate-binding protein [Bauldia sp.]|uniref:metal ABC transporter solute-binding protein, Zn/Mn family n=1 Tax=Bauldia sp. TaxID=2575872 RepID=UPI001E075B69|nr:zinc ABC transporter substrate-binding protein [Bauldia sp.]MCB1494472.1 zinc ABC transporter substrate-binding protein [Bauldia sp.]